MKRNFDSRHKAAPLQPLNAGDIVWIPEDDSEGIVVEETSSRSYTVQRQNGTLRRNCRDLILMPNTEGIQSDEQSSQNCPVQNEIESVSKSTRSSEYSNVVTQSGHVSKPPDRFVYLN